MSNHAKKTGSRPNQKPSRQEVAQGFMNVANDLNELRVALAWTVDLLIAKKLFTGEELQAFFNARKVQAQEAMQAALNPPPADVAQVTEAESAANLEKMREELVASS
jgi:hypothetical protein